MKQLTSTPLVGGRMQQARVYRPIIVTVERTLDPKVAQMEARKASRIAAECNRTARMERMVDIALAFALGATVTLAILICITSGGYPWY